jgi:predicted O-methyltransferase YrrM
MFLKNTHYHQIAKMYGRECIHPSHLNLDNFLWGDTGNVWQLSLLVTLAKDNNVFEIGTYRGRTTDQLAKVAKKVVTLDWDSTPTEDVPDNGYSNYTVGEIYKKNNRTNVTQLIGDSRTINLSKYYNQFNVVYLDGGHTEEMAYNDFYLALNLLKDGGIIIIDDSQWEGVYHAMHRLRNEGFEIPTVHYINYYIKRNKPCF